MNYARIVIQIEKEEKTIEELIEKQKEEETINKEKD